MTDPTLFKNVIDVFYLVLYDEVKAHIQEMLEVGVIQSSTSPWASAVVLV